MRPTLPEIIRLHLTRKTPLCGIMAALALIFAVSCCDMQTAGTSVGTGNPTEIQVAFKNDSGSVLVNGTLSVYASTQIPVPGFSPAPLLSVPVTNTNHAQLQAAAFAALPDSLWPKASIDHGLYAFNVVVTGADQGGIFRGFSFRKEQGDFVLPAEAADAEKIQGTAIVTGALSPLVEIDCSLDTSSLSANRMHYLFMYGTGYGVAENKGQFVFPSIPKGEYTAFMISLPKVGSGNGEIGDSLYVYSLNADITSGNDNALSYDSIEAILPIPESLKPH